MDEAKRKEVLELIKLGKEKGVSFAKMHPKSKGSTVCKILKNPEKIMTSNEKTLSEIEQNIKLRELDNDLDKENGKLLSNSLSNIDKSLDKNNNEILERIGELEKENRELKKKVDELTKLVMESNTPAPVERTTPRQEDLKLYGFTLQQRGTGTDNKYWYAGKSFDGKLKWVYIGKDKNKASRKIESWLLSNGHSDLLVKN